MELLRCGHGLELISQISDFQILAMQLPLLLFESLMILRFKGIWFEEILPRLILGFLILMIKNLFRLLYDLCLLR